LFAEYTKGMSVQSICAELNSYVAMCNQFSLGSVLFKGGAAVSDCAAGENWGSSSNPAALVCNFSKLLQRALPDDVLELLMFDMNCSSRELQFFLEKIRLVFGNIFINELVYIQ